MSLILFAYDDIQHLMIHLTPRFTPFLRSYTRGKYKNCESSKKLLTQTVKIDYFGPSTQVMNLLWKHNFISISMVSIEVNECLVPGIHYEYS